MRTIEDYFRGRKLAIVTKHEKEKVIAPLLEKALGVRCYVPDHIDTDILGTFTGEVERKDDPLSTLRNKCMLAMDNQDCDLCVASEGSFGPHPAIFFVNADDELLMLIDRKNDLSVISRELSTATNFNGREVATERQLREFAKEVLFPSHGLILRNAKNGMDCIIKGITEWETLNRSFGEIQHRFGTVYAETDMRAMYNPSRCEVIGKAAEKLIATLLSQCPECGTPGFDVTKIKKGLPCSWCGFPTESTWSYVYQCAKCTYSSEKRFPHGKTREDPMYCGNCNP